MTPLGSTSQPSEAASLPNPARQLAGAELEGGWRVVALVELGDDHSGAYFSQGYVVEQRPSGRRGFLKALDYTRALKEPDPAPVLHALTQAFIHERNLLARCNGLHRVVKAIADGRATVEGQTVQYLIFELATMDARSQANVSKRFELAWTLRALHHVATGLFELHGIGVAHQDLKPSNVLIFDDGTKVGDLGRASSKGSVSPHEDYEIAGDMTYAPPELLYHAIATDWNRRRVACDVYLLGSIATFFFSGLAMTAWIRAELEDSHSWRTWTGTYDEVLPYVRAAFDRAVDALKPDIPSEVRDELITTIRELCDPDPSVRGHPLNRAQSRNRYSLERYVSRFNLLARRAELGLLQT